MTDEIMDEMAESSEGTDDFDQEEQAAFSSVEQDDEADDFDDEAEDEDDGEDDDDDSDDDDDDGEDDEDDDEDDKDDDEQEDASKETTKGSVPQLSDEELDQIADTAIAALEDILKYFNLGEVTIDEYEGDEGELILDITGSDLAVLIGRHGKTLDALQFLISSITARTIGFRYPVVVDVEGYKSRQRQKLESLAFSSAKRALSQGRSVKMRPMSPYERRIIHIALRDFEGVETASEGEGSARHVVVLPVE